MVGLFDVDWKFKFGETDSVNITCEGKHNAIYTLRDLAQHILSLDFYQLELCLDMEASKENPVAIIRKLRSFIKDAYNKIQDKDKEVSNILRQALILSDNYKGDDE